MNYLQLETIDEILINLALRVKNIRKRRKITQDDISKMSGVSLGSVKRFETTGQISLYSLTKIAVALGLVEEIKSLFTDVIYLSIDEVLNENY